MEIKSKITEYKNFIEEKLKPDLKDIEIILADKASKYKEWNELKNVVDVIKDFKEKDRDMHIQMELGSDIRTFGNISDYENFYVDIGLGYLLEMNCDEAIKYSDIRLRLLKKEIDQLRKLAVNVKVHIKMVLLALNELQTALYK